MSKIKQKLRTVLNRFASKADLHSLLAENARYRARIEDSLVLQAQMLAANYCQLPADTALGEVEFRAFSQFGEDGILQFLIAKCGIEAHERTFIEFGVECYEEANTRLLLLKDYWRGMVIDASASNIDLIRSDRLYWRHDLSAVRAWVDRDNINELLLGAGFSGRVGVLSIDLDGNDYWILEAIHAVDPVILVVEWNSVFGPNFAVSVPYQRDFDRRAAHYSQQYWGASICAFELLAARKGYRLIGSNRAGNNLFFVREDRLGGLPVRSASEIYVQACFRDSRSESGQLTFLSGAQRAEPIADLPLVNVRNDQMTSMRALSIADTRSRA